MLVLRHEDVMTASKWIADKCNRYKLHRIFPVPRGGIPVAYAVSCMVPGSIIVNTPHMADVIVDDIIDSGATREKFPSHVHFYAIANKCEKYTELASMQSNDWVVFPWEKKGDGEIEDNVTRILQYIGEDAARQGLHDTPKRYLKAWKEWTSGYKQDPLKVLGTQFDDGAEGYDELVMIDPIQFFSMCEHHMAPFLGSVHIAYIPSKRIVGLSKLCRLVEVFARRLQVQERMTVQITDTINEALAPVGVAVMIRAQHLCMASRGVRAIGADTTTVALRGVFKESPAARAEFMSLVKGR